LRLSLAQELSQYWVHDMRVIWKYKTGGDYRHFFVDVPDSSRRQLESEWESEHQDREILMIQGEPDVPYVSVPIEPKAVVKQTMTNDSYADYWMTHHNDVSESSS